MFCDAIGQQRTIYTFQLKPYISDIKWEIKKIVSDHTFLLLFHWFCRQWLKNTSRKQVIFKITHYKNNAFFISQNACVALTIVNVEYSEFMNLLKNQNVLRTLTRSTFTHIQNIAIIAFHSVVKVWCTFLHNAPKCSPDNEIATSWPPLPLPGHSWSPPVAPRTTSKSTRNHPRASWSPPGALLKLSRGSLPAFCLPYANNKREVASEQSPASSRQPAVTTQRCSGI